MVRDVTAVVIPDANGYLLALINFRFIEGQSAMAKPSVPAPNELSNFRREPAKCASRAFDEEDPVVA